MKFRTAYCEKTTIPCPSGSRYRQHYKRGISSDGSKILVKDCVEDVYDSIQKAAAGNTIDDLIRRAQGGDPDAIPSVVESFGDFSQMPTDLLSAHSMLLDAQAKFDSLPVDFRSKFDNSFGKFISGLGDGTVASLLQVNKSHSAVSSSGTSFTEEEINKIRDVINGGSNNA